MRQETNLPGTHFLRTLVRELLQIEDRPRAPFRGPSAILTLYNSGISVSFEKYFKKIWIEL